MTTAAAHERNASRIHTPDYKRLSSLDWTFEEASTRGGIHGVHPYPAKFIPQIPRALIAALHPRDGTAVLDPFCGSGTTLVEAALCGIPAVGVDLHPLACLISKVKVTPVTADLTGAAAAAVDRAIRSSATIPAIPALNHWFKPEAQGALAALTEGISAETDVDVRDALRVALSSIVVRVSNEESDTRYAAIDKPVTAKSVAEQFFDAARGLAGALAGTWGGLFAAAPVSIINKDILDIERADIPAPVSLVVTSPPYPNAYEYWLYHKYRMYWLGMDPVAVRQREIGARPHFFKRNPHTADDFQRQMTQVFALLASVVVPHGHACFQVGTSRIKGEIVDNAAMLREAATRNGFVEAVSLTRAIPLSRKAFNPRHGRIKEETIVIFRREDT